MPSSGVNTAERVPTTTSTSPRRMRCHWSCRSPVESPLCWIATRAPKCARNTPVAAGVSAISGTMHEHAPAGRDDVRRETEIQLRLAAAGDAVQQDRAEQPGRRRLFQMSKRRRLLGRERVRARRHLAERPMPALARRLVLGERIALDDGITETHDAKRRERSDGARARRPGAASSDSVSPCALSRSSASASRCLGPRSAGVSAPATASASFSVRNAVRPSRADGGIAIDSASPGPAA